MDIPSTSECYRGAGMCRWCAKAEKERTFIMRDGLLHYPPSGRSENPCRGRRGNPGHYHVHDAQGRCGIETSRQRAIALCKTLGPGAVVYDSVIKPGTREAEVIFENEEPNDHRPVGLPGFPTGGYGPRRGNPALLVMANPSRSQNPQKLLRKEDLKRLPPMYSQENNPDPTVWVKFFTPWAGWTWYITEFDGEDTLFGLTDGHEMELGYISLSELQSLRGPAGLRVERDIHWKPTPLSKVRSREVNPGRAVPSHIKKSWEKFHQTEFAGKCREIADIPGAPSDLMELGEFVDAVAQDGERIKGGPNHSLCYEPSDKSLWIISQRAALKTTSGKHLATVAYRTFGKSGKDHAVYEHKFHRPLPRLVSVHSRAAILDGGRYIVTDWIRR